MVGVCGIAIHCYRFQLLERDTIRRVSFLIIGEDWPLGTPNSIAAVAPWLVLETALAA
jgi:hypothetical protein